MRSLKVFTDKSHFTDDNRAHLHDLLRPYWNNHPLNEREDIYGERYHFFTLTEDIHEADFCVLPMKWAYYVTRDLVQLALEFVNAAEAAGKVTVVSSPGDQYYDVPFSGRVVIFQASLYRSIRKPNEFIVPPIFKDNVQIYRDGTPNYRRKTPRPVVGFCGNATDDPLIVAQQFAKNVVKNVRQHLHLAANDFSPIVPPAYLRARTLKRFAAADLVDANFVFRKQYWAGISSSSDRADPFNPSKVEFINNLDESDYVVAIRGAGNWSKRFYEALNWGRIPILIDTDSVLPYDFVLDWKQYCVWIDKHEISHAAEKVADFHAQLSPDDFLDLQHKCRQLWIDRLAPDGFYRHLSEHFSVVAS